QVKRNDAVGRKRGRPQARRPLRRPRLTQSRLTGVLGSRRGFRLFARRSAIVSLGAICTIRARRARKKPLPRAARAKTGSIEDELRQSDRPVEARLRQIAV